MNVYLVALAVVAALWLLLSFKTSRPDGTLLRVPPFRRLMFYIMPGRNESVVFFDSYIRADKLIAYLDRAKLDLEADLTHVCVGAVGIGLGSTPRMNRFVAGRRLYERKGRWITFSMKRKKLDREAKLSAVKLEMKDGETFPELVKRINANIIVERSGKKTRNDKEFDLFNLLPRPLLRGAASLLRSLDYFNLLPGAFIEPDGMYTSVFIANLGSLGMAPGYHHLYEYGSCPLFMMVGQLEDAVFVVDGKIEVGKRLHVRYTYDERIDDGLNARFGIDAVKTVLEDPFRWLGGVNDARTPPMWPNPEWIPLGDAPKKSASNGTPVAELGVGASASASDRGTA
ncbi:2-oxo acid dehydrogenase subunit E2 [Myxococcota bacterium]|nr:2-oxo acid dehydrogenase subunit E2 [Myxococcota bacterium]